MTKLQIIKAACTFRAADFLSLMEHNGVFVEILDQDNIMDANDGCLNVIVEGLGEGDALLFIDGDLTDKKLYKEIYEKG
jgi:hypothetical protein